MALGGHERERLVIGIEDEDAGREPDRGAGHGLDLEQADLAGLDPRQRRVEPLPLRPELGEVRLPGRDDRLGRRVHAFEPDRERLLPQLAEPLERAGRPLPGDGVILGSVGAGARQAIDWLRPIRGIAVGRGSDLRRRCGLRLRHRASSVLWSGPGQAMAAATADASSSWIAIASSRRVSSKIWR